MKIIKYFLIILAVVVLSFLYLKYPQFVYYDGRMTIANSSPDCIGKHIVAYDYTSIDGGRKNFCIGIVIWSTDR